VRTFLGDTGEALIARSGPLIVATSRLIVVTSRLTVATSRLIPGSSPPVPLSLRERGNEGPGVVSPLPKGEGIKGVKTNTRERGSNG